jgi:hypothetical protein
MPDTNTNTIERKIEGDFVSPDSAVTETPSPLIETGGESTTPHPENFFQNELKPPTEEAFTNTTSLPTKDITSTDRDISPINTGEGYRILPETVNIEDPKTPVDILTRKVRGLSAK